MEYDTKKIRRAAKKIGSCADSFIDDSSDSLRRITNEIPEYFEGEAADAFGELLDKEKLDAQAIYKIMRKLSKTLYAYADALDEADRKAADMF